MLALGLKRPKGNSADDNSLRIIRIEVMLAHEQSLPSPYAKTARRRPVAPRATTTAEKNLAGFNAAQPIEKPRFGRENPRKSKLIQHSRAGSSAPDRREPRKAKPIDRRRRGSY
jgi:hypothetical protein